jgi:hypothetical protein
LKRTHHFFAGEAAGEALAFAGEAAGAALASGEALVSGPGEAVGLAEAAGLGEASGVGEGSVAGFDGAEGGGAPPSLTTDFVPMPGIENISARNIKINAATTVAFSSGFCAPRGPKAVWLPDPPKAAATSPPFPDCKRITRIRKAQTKTKII